MKVGKLFAAALAVTGMSFISAGAHAAAITVVGDAGTLRVVTPTLASNVSLVKPYGTDVNVPTITQNSATQYEIDFVPGPDFFASATAQPAGQTTTMDGKLDIFVSFPNTIHLTTNVFEDGLWQTSGTGTVSVIGGGGLIVTAVDPITHVSLGESVGNTFSTSAVATFSGNGMWKLFDQATGFTGEYTTYKISIDNVLLAQAPLPTPNAQGDAFVSKKDFSLLLTTDGSGGPNVPEPASLGVLALGGLALLARRRRT